MSKIKTMIKCIFIGISLLLTLAGSFFILMLLNHDFFLYVTQHFATPSHYSISGSDFDGNWIVDTKNSVTLENKGQSIFIDDNVIYSYGKSGYICIYENEPQIKVYYDENTTKEAIMRWSQYKNSYKNQLIIINNINDLFPRERKYYDELKTQHMKYPFRY
ncbi:hypothetical protein [Megasphaera sp. DISK 18]|uniref:hypothetical protein n=1 Tax=Megasphaera sp. DISK 18 TaxID=1776081 RepID=UPI0008071796|nr:hypothetical protein [Megasphaera sp. DISK 18]OBZ32105.1 hypothetical protein A0U42_02860 [Megasphaera sp. DISK 18]